MFATTELWMEMMKTKQHTDGWLLDLTILMTQHSWQINRFNPHKYFYWWYLYNMQSHSGSPSFFLVTLMVLLHSISWWILWQMTICSLLTGSRPSPCSHTADASRSPRPPARTCVTCVTCISITTPRATCITLPAVQHAHVLHGDHVPGRHL